MQIWFTKRTEECSFVVYDGKALAAHLVSIGFRHDPPAMTELYRLSHNDVIIHITPTNKVHVTGINTDYGVRVLEAANDGANDDQAVVAMFARCYAFLRELDVKG